MVSRSTSLNSGVNLLSVVSFNRMIGLALLTFIFSSVGINTANSQCNLMLTNPNVQLTTGTGSSAMLDAMAVAGNISLTPAGCPGYDYHFFDANATDLGSNVTISCNGTGNQAGSYFLQLINPTTMNSTQLVEFNVSIMDTAPPTFTAPIPVTVNCETNLADLTILGDVTDEMDNCASGIQATFSDAALPTGCNGTGSFVRTWSLSDGTNPPVTKTQMITIQDITAPTFMPPANITVELCSTDITNPANTGGMPTMVNDNCSMGITPTFSDGPMTSTGNMSCPAEMKVERTWSLVDACGNSTQLKQEIILKDLSKPVVTMMDSVKVNNTPGMCNAMATVVLNGTNTTDNCTTSFMNLMISNNRTMGGADASDTYPVGTTPVIFTIIDECGNSLMHTVQVVVTDNQAPMITGCPMDVTLNADNNDCDNTYSWTAPTVMDNCGASNVVEVLESDTPNLTLNQGTPGPGRVDFADFPVGTHNIRYVFTDGSLVRDTCAFTVTILDNQAPTIISCPNGQTQDFGVCNAANVSVPDFRGIVGITDNCGADFTVTQVPAPNTLVSTVLLGASPTDNAMYPVTITVQDNNSPQLSSGPCTFMVTMNDDTSLGLTEPGAVLDPATNECGAVEVCAPTAIDQCGNLVIGTPFPAIGTEIGTCSSPGTAEAPVSSSPNLIIPTSNPNNNFELVHTFAVTGLGNLVESIEVDLNILHTWVGDLSATLTSPSGTVVSLFSRPGFPASTFGCGFNNINVSFSDNAVSSYTDFNSTCNLSTAPTTFAIAGAFQPQESLSNFAGDMANGNWVLRITDSFNGDGGSLENITLNLVTQGTLPIPLYSFPAGTNTTIDWNYDDGNGNLAQQSQSINASSDATDPTINCQNITVELDENGNANITPEAVAGEVLTLSTQNPGNFNQGNVQYCITAPAATTLSFAWDYDNSNDISAFYDPFGYSIDGNLTLLATSSLFNDPSSTIQSGIFSQALSAGEAFCFYIQTDNLGAPTVDITNISPSLASGDFANANWTTVTNNANSAINYTEAGIMEPCGVNLSTLAINGAPSFAVSCADMPSVPVNITVLDINGNDGSCAATVTIVDNIAPVIAGIANDTLVNCNALPSVNMPTVTDNCNAGLMPVFSGVSTKNGNPATSGDYNYTITRTWSVTDNSGNTTVGTQIVTVQDTLKPMNGMFSSNIPSNDVISTDPNGCNANVSLALTSAEDCAPFANLTITNDSHHSFAGGADASGSYPVGPHVVNFRVEDPSGNVKSFNKAFTVRDEVSPIAICKNVTLGLPSNGSLTLLPAFINDGSTDNCPGSLIYHVFPDHFDCSNATNTPIEVILTVTDASGNTSACTGFVTIQDNIAPVPTCLSDTTLVLDANGMASLSPSDVLISVDEICQGVHPLDFSLSLTDFDETDIGLFTQTTLTAFDPIGMNAGNCVTNVTVAIPQTCINVGAVEGPSGTVVNVPVTATNFTNVGGFQFLLVANNESILDILDVVPTSALGFGPVLIANEVGEDSIRISFTTNTPLTPITVADGTVLFNIEVLLTGVPSDFSFLVLTDDAVNGFPSQINHYYNGALIGQNPPICVTDGSVEINAPASLRLAGDIFNEHGDGIKDVTVDITSGINTIASPVTGLPGIYEVFPVLSGENYLISPSKDLGWTNGISPFDLSEIQRHVVGLDTLPTVYRIMAANADGDGIISTFDVLQLQILVASSVGPNLQTPAGQTSWVFVPAVDTPAIDPLLPLIAPNFSQTKFIANLMVDSVENDFIGVKIGDVTGDAAPDLIVSHNAEDRNGAAAWLTTTDVITAKDELVTLPFHFGKTEQWIAGQSVFSFNTDALEFVEVKIAEGSGFKASDFGTDYLDLGKLSIIAWGVEETTSKSDDLLFELVFKAKQTAKMSRVLSIDESKLSSNIYDESGIVSKLGLEFIGGETILTDNTLFQNRPNPFVAETTIGFNLASESFGTLTISDISGRVLIVKNQTWAAGYNEVTLDRGDLPESGVLYYSLETEDFSAVKKMTIIGK